MSGTIIFFDLETGGVEDDHPDIQIAAIATQDLHEVEVFERKLIFDEADCTPEALEINSYDPAEWAKHAVPHESAWKSFGYFCRRHADTTLISKRTGNSYRATRLAGQNVVSFDIPRARRAMDASGFGFWPACWWYPFDTYQRAIWYFEEHGLDTPPDFQLGTLAEHFGIQVEGDAHDALTDVRTTIEITRHLLGQVSR